MNILDLIGHSNGEFPKECAMDLLELIRKGELKKNPMKALACILPMVSWLVNWIANKDDEPTPVIGTAGPGEELAILGQVCEAIGEPIPMGGLIDDMVVGRIKAALVKLLKEIIEDPSIVIDGIKALIDELT